MRRRLPRILLNTATAASLVLSLATLAVLLSDVLVVCRCGTIPAAPPT